MTSQSQPAFGYDDAGRLVKRQQYFTALEGKSLTVDSSYGGDGRVFQSRTFGTIGAVATTQGDPHLTYALKYDSAGRPITVTGTLRGSTATVMYQAYAANAADGAKWGAFDQRGRPSLIKADDGLAVSARVYDRYSGTLVMECKRVGDLACENLVASNGQSGAPAPSAARDLYRTDETRASYVGGLLASYKDRGTGTTYGATYQPSGKVQTATATSAGALAGRQDFEESYTYDGLGSLKTTQVKKDKDTSGAWVSDLKDTYTPATASGTLDQVRSIGTTKDLGSYPAASEVVYTYDAVNRLRTVTRSGVTETLHYGPAGELTAKQVGTSWTFWVGEYATVTATIPTGCGSSPCAAQNVAVDAHVLFAGTRIASAGKPAGATASRTLYYYRTRLGTVIGTSLRGGTLGAVYRYTPYGAVAYNTENPTTRSELGYTNALRLSGNLLHLKTRAYDPEARIFLQADSLDRQRYAYVRGDPQNYSDPTGMMQIHERQEHWRPFTVSLEYDWGATPNILYGQTANSENAQANSGNGLDYITNEEMLTPDEDGYTLDVKGLPRNRDSRNDYKSPDEASAAAGKLAHPVSDREQTEYGWQVRPTVGKDGTPTGGYYFTQFVKGHLLPSGDLAVTWNIPFGGGWAGLPGVSITAQGHTHPSSPGPRWLRALVDPKANRPSREDYQLRTRAGVPLYIVTPDGIGAGYMLRIDEGQNWGLLWNDAPTRVPLP